MRNPLILMASSAAQKDVGQAVAAYDLYDGPLWRTLRSHRGVIAWEKVFVLSPKYGFISATTMLEPYRETWSWSKSRWYMQNHLKAPNNMFGKMRMGGPSVWDEIMEYRHNWPVDHITGVMIAAGSRCGYAATLSEIADKLRQEHLVWAGARIERVPQAVSGVQMAALRTFLRWCNSRDGSGFYVDRTEANGAGSPHRANGSGE